MPSEPPTKDPSARDDERTDPNIALPQQRSGTAAPAAPTASAPVAAATAATRLSQIPKTTGLLPQRSPTAIVGRTAEVVRGTDPTRAPILPASPPTPRASAPSAAPRPSAPTMVASSGAAPTGAAGHTAAPAAVTPASVPVSSTASTLPGTPAKGAPAVSATSPGVAPAAAADRPSAYPSDPASGLLATMLIPRPSTPPAAAAGRPSDPGGDPLRERLAQMEVQSAATRSIATRVETEAGRAHARLDAIEASLKDRGTQLDEAIASARRTLEARIEDVLTSRPTENAGIALIPPDLDQKLAEIRELAAPMRTALATMRQELSQHDRQFEARRARLDSLETRVASLENDARFVELRRASEAFDLRLVAIERAQQAIRESIEGRFAALEARMAELAAAPAASAPAKKKKDETESELRRIKGIGPKYEKALRDLGVTTLASVAALSDDDLGKLAVTLATPVERLRKLGWIEAARALLADAPSE